MANTAAKLNSFIALGYSLSAKETQIKPDTTEYKQDDTNNIILPNDTENEKLLPTNSQVFNSLNIQIVSSGLRI